MKIRAYTLMELTVAMLISAICISICYTAYGIVNRYYSIFHQKNKLVTEAVLLKKNLELDFVKSSRIVRKENGISLFSDSIKTDYVFYENGIIRLSSSMPVDTFKLKAVNWNTFFEQRFVLDTVLIDELSFKIHLADNIVVPMQLYKHYSAENLFHVYGHN